MRRAICIAALSALAACGVDADEGGGAPITVNQDISADTTWSPSSGDCDVVVEKVVNVKAALTVKAGTKVCFAAKAGLIVTSTGSLNATGTASERIAFTGQSATKGFWRAIGFLSVNGENKLIHTDISYAGATEGLCCGFFAGSEDVVAAIMVGDTSTSAQVTLQDSAITQSGGHGLFAFINARLEGFARNRFAQNELTPLTLYYPQVERLDTASVYGGGGSANGRQWVRVLDPDVDLSANITFRKLDVPYGMGQGLTEPIFNVTGQMTVEAGARLEFEGNSGIIFKPGGMLRAIGTSTSRITFTGRSPTKGFWKGLGFLSVGNELTYVDVSYGGNDDALCCGFFEPNSGPSTRANLVVGDYSTSGGLTLNNVTSTQSGNRGISVLKGTVTQSGTNDLVSGNTTANLGL